ncbi:hypothetical protein EVAR_6954_1 [Eumeta japonica]|uniref:Uncharacterized protein n=1 Tax=Eumeta variegata TaxID=151549 RepID=A0A4C1THE2_EUMVA|nr:hypothetical protein EVAR_6954_1 [Eumeta japonica]
MNTSPPVAVGSERDFKYITRCKGSVPEGFAWGSTGLSLLYASDRLLPSACCRTSATGHTPPLRTSTAQALGATYTRSSVEIVSPPTGFVVPRRRVHVSSTYYREPVRRSSSISLTPSYRPVQLPIRFFSQTKATSAKVGSGWVTAAIQLKDLECLRTNKAIQDVGPVKPEPTKRSLAPVLTHWMSNTTQRSPVDYQIVRTRDRLRACLSLVHPPVAVLFRRHEALAERRKVSREKSSEKYIGRRVRMKKSN